MKRYTIRTTKQLDKWFNKLPKFDRLRIAHRFERIEEGNFGDCKNISNGISELRFFFGGGYRIYYTIKGVEIVLLLCGGDKSSQSNDIKKAIEILGTIED